MFLGGDVWPQTEAALLWYGWNRYEELIGLKRFTNGWSGSDVLVFQPRLAPGARRRGEKLADNWGSLILVKTADAASVCKEWGKFQEFLADRLHPFMARNEAFLPAQPVFAHTQDLQDRQQDPREASPRATIVGSFLGGGLLEVEPLELMARGAFDPDRCRAVIERLFGTLSAWYAGWMERPLGEWTTMFGPDGGRKEPLKLFDKYDLREKKDRDKYTEALGLAWERDFSRESHLSHHLLGKKEPDGLLHRLCQIPVRFSVAHGDLHPRNILTDRANIWLLDFGETGFVPTLFDFTKLEVYLRLYCLDMAAAKDIEENTFALEKCLLDHMVGSEGSLEPVRALAPGLGVSAQELVKVAHFIARIRREAAPYCVGAVDRKDYLAVLYLTVLQTLQYANKNPEWGNNYRLLIALSYFLEDVLSRAVGLREFPRMRVPMDFKCLLSRDWLAARGAPQRVVYFLEREDGCRALAPLVATRGVMQGPYHHLDVFDHTLLVLAYLEEIVQAADPLAGLLDPAELDRRVGESLRQQGISLPPPFPNPDDGVRPDVGTLEPLLNGLRDCLQKELDAEAVALLKWSVLFHDVGKTATRCLSVPRWKEDAAPVQFWGHEVYGLRLVAEHLAYVFPKEPPRARIENLIRRHHYHNLLAMKYHDAVQNPDANQKIERLKRCVADLRNCPFKEFQGQWELVRAALFREEAVGEGEPARLVRREDFPLLLLHGYADSLASRGPQCLLPLHRRAELYLTFLAAWQNQNVFEELNEGWQKCLAVVTRKENQALHALVQDCGLRGADLGKVLNLLRDWAWEQVRGGAGCPTPEAVVARAREELHP
jgi:hypothetical protein